MNTYQTITQPSEALFKEKGSKFLAFIYPVDSLDKVNEYLEECRQIHPKATHHCTAYKIGTQDAVERANDDGEPSGSAGKPILGQIHSFELTNILIIVVRYYGGTKLGVGGLQTAYKTATKLAIENNTIETKNIPCYYTLRFPFDQQGKVEHQIKLSEGQLIEKQFTNTCQFKIQIPKAHSENFESKMNQEHTIEMTTEN
jgi:uncharacterized YigZ family protein